MSTVIKFVVGIRYVSVDSLPPGVVAFLPYRRPGESDADLMCRVVFVTGVGDEDHQS